MYKRFVPVIILIVGVLGFVFLKMARPEPALAQANPMATSIAFGLELSTVLVLLVIPALLSWLEQLREWRASRYNEELT